MDTNAQAQKGFTVRIADVTIQVTSEQLLLEPHSIYKDFLTTDTQPDILLQVHYGDIPDIRPEQKIFDSGGVWSLHNWHGKYLLSFVSPVFGPHPYRLATFDPDFSHGDLYIREEGNIQETSDIDALEYPLDELLMVNFLSLGRGIDIHACGVVFDSCGLVFCGVSEAGKSTLGELWKRRGVKILSDDRLILRRQDGGIWVHGTPWHGDARISLAEKAPLKALYFIRHGQENQIIPLSHTEVVTRLLVRSFPTFYNLQGMEYTLDFIAELAQEIPCYELGFVPDQSVIDEVLNHIESHML